MTITSTRAQKYPDRLKSTQPIKKLKYSKALLGSSQGHARRPAVMEMTTVTNHIMVKAHPSLGLFIGRKMS